MPRWATNQQTKVTFGMLMECDDQRCQWLDSGKQLNLCLCSGNSGRMERVLTQSKEHFCVVLNKWKLIRNHGKHKALYKFPSVVNHIMSDSSTKLAKEELFIV